MKPYLDLLQHVLDNGERRTDRTGVGTISVFGAQTRYDLRDGFPLVTTKRVPFSMVVRELLWFLTGSTNIKDLGPAAKLWEPWADSDGNLGPVYGAQWRRWPSSFGVHDQIADTLAMIKRSPDSRRMVISAWNVGQIDAMRLPPCHALFQFYVSGDGHLDLQLYQRSADLAIGVPFNIASYALLLSMFANECGLTPRYFVHTFGDAHIYLNHVDGVREQLGREPRALPRLVLKTGLGVLRTGFEDVVLVNYDPHPSIKFDVAV